MEIRLMRLDCLFPADYNPRKALKRGDPEYEKLWLSIETFGLLRDGQRLDFSKVFGCE